MADFVDLLCLAAGSLTGPRTEPGGLSGLVYLLCAATSCLAAVMLLRGYARTRVRLLFWSGLCFVGLALDNVLLYVDLIVVPAVDISVWRRIPALVAMSLLMFGLVWESK